MRVPHISPDLSSSQDINVEKQTILIDSYDAPDYYDRDLASSLEDEKTLTQYIKKIEKYVRQSFEYKEYIRYLRETVDMNTCTFFHNIDTSDGYNMHIEFHHAPFTLYDICSIVLARYIDSGRKFSQMQVANKVCSLHYEGLVGLIPLSVTVHKLVHQGSIFIPIQNVYGNIKSFVKIYKPYINNELIGTLKYVLQASKLVTNNEYQPDVLKQKFTYLKIDGMEFPNKLEIDQAIIA